MKRYPGWQTNLFLFSLITILVGSYFYRQTMQASQELLNHSQDHSEILAAVVELNIRNALLSQNAIEETVATSLENSARFIHYLDAIEPFSSDELTAFATEAGLAGVRIIRGDSTVGVSGPSRWLSGKTCPESAGLERIDDKHLYLYSYFPDNQYNANSELNCVFVALSSFEIDVTLDKISVDRLLTMFDDMHDIAYVRFRRDDMDSDTDYSLIRNDKIMETVVSIQDRDLIVALKMDRFGKRRIQMKNEFIVFITFLILFGGFSSWWLYRVQRQRLQQTREFERKMARQHEDAALGRAAATITHELRNPLNAIGMGLQRMQIESENLAQDHYKLIASMRNAVDRTNTIISRLNQYMYAVEVSGKPVNIKSVLRQEVTLYEAQCRKQNIDITLNCEQDCLISGDKVLLEQLFENLIKNSVEAQLNGGFINITMTQVDGNCCVNIENGGFLLTVDESKLLFEPYFTQKSRGTGLGLVISKKIVMAHKGVLTWQGDFQKQSIKFLITLPVGNS